MLKSIKKRVLTHSREFRKDKRGVAAIWALVTASIAIAALVIIFAIIPMIGYQVDTAVSIPGNEYADGTLTFTGTSVYTQTVNISSETYKFINESAEATDKYDVPIETSMNASYSCAQLVAEITANSSLVGAADNGDNSTTITAKTIGTAANSYGTTTNVTGTSFDATTLTGGQDASDWSADADTNIVTGVSLWGSVGPLIKLVAIVSFLGLVIGSVIALAGRREGGEGGV